VFLTQPEQHIAPVFDLGETRRILLHRLGVLSGQAREFRKIVVGGVQQLPPRHHPGIHLIELAQEPVSLPEGVEHTGLFVIQQPA